MQIPTAAVHHFKGPLFPWIDHGFILTTKGQTGEKRIHDCMAQLEKFPLCAKVTVLTFVARKDCQHQQRMFHTTDAVIHYSMCYAFSLAGRTGHCLILEDDMLISDDIASHAARVRDGALSCDVYSLGCTPMLWTPDGDHRRLHVAGGSHAVIYSPLAQSEICSWPYNRGPSFMSSHLIDFMIFARLDAKCYGHPLVFQPYMDTTNSREWSNWVFNWFIRVHKGDVDPEHFHKLIYRYPLGFIGTFCMIVFVLISVVVALLLRSRLRKNKCS